jgi:hypothetical protein
MNIKIYQLGKFSIYLIILISIISGGLISDFGFPSTIKYLSDIGCLLLLLCLIIERLSAHFSYNKIPKAVYFTLFLLIFLDVIGSFINFQSLLLTISGYRTLFRFFVFYIGCFTFLKKHDIVLIFKMFFVFQFFNLILAFYQFSVLGLFEDKLGGFFGHGNGAALNVFQALLFAYYYVAFLFKKEPFYKLIFVIASAFIISALAEEKAFFLYFFIILILGLILKPNFRAFVYDLILIAVCFLGFLLLGKVNVNDSFGFLFNFGSLYSYADISYGISRINPYPTINSYFFKNNPLLYLFGFGLGNCNYSEIPGLSSGFYYNYASTNYNYFSHSFLLLSTGYVGFLLYCLFILLNSHFGIKKRTLLGFVTAIYSIVLLVSMMAAPSLIINEGYICYFGLALFGINYQKQMQGETYDKKDLKKTALWESC